MWFKESNVYVYKIESFAFGEINEMSFSNPHPWVGIGMYYMMWLLTKNMSWYSNKRDVLFGI